MTEEGVYLLRICIIGTYDGFRTDFTHTFIERKFTSNPVGGVDIFTKRIVVDNQPINLIVANLNPMFFSFSYDKKLKAFYRGASACIIFFDKDNRQSFEDVSKWYKEFKGHIIPPVPIALVGFISDDDIITFDEGQTLADKLNLAFFECKPTDKRKVLKIFEFLATKAIDK